MSRAGETYAGQSQGIEYFISDLKDESTVEDIAQLHVRSWASSTQDVFRIEWLREEMPLYWPKHYRELAEEPANRRTVVVARRDGKLVGFGVGRPEEDRYYIANLHVEPSLRGKRLGVALSDLLGGDAVKQGCSESSSDLADGRLWTPPAITPFSDRLWDHDLNGVQAEWSLADIKPILASRKLSIEPHRSSV